MRRICSLCLVFFLLVLSAGCAFPGLQGGYTADGYQWDAVDYVQGDPYCTLTAQRSPQEGSWYCYVDILSREVVDVSLVVPDETVGEPQGYGFYVDDTVSTYAFYPTSEEYEGDWYLLFTPSQPLSLEDDASYFIGVKGASNSTNLVVIPSQVGEAMDQFLVQWYGSLEAAQEEILAAWQPEGGPPFDGEFWEGDLWSDGFWDGILDDELDRILRDIFGVTPLPPQEGPDGLPGQEELPEEILPEAPLPDGQLPEDGNLPPEGPEGGQQPPLPGITGPETPLGEILPAGGSPLAPHGPKCRPGPAHEAAPLGEPLPTGEAPLPPARPEGGPPSPAGRQGPSRRPPVEGRPGAHGFL